MAPIIINEAVYNQWTGNAHSLLTIIYISAYVRFFSIAMRVYHDRISISWHISTGRTPSRPSNTRQRKRCVYLWDVTSTLRSDCCVRWCLYFNGLCPRPWDKGCLKMNLHSNSKRKSSSWPAPPFLAVAYAAVPWALPVGEAWCTVLHFISADFIPCLYRGTKYIWSFLNT